MMLREPASHSLGRLSGRVDQMNIGAGNFLQSLLQQWVMGAPQDQGVDPLVKQGGKILSSGQPGDLVAGPALFSKGDKEWAGCSKHHDIVAHCAQGTLVGSAANRPFRTDHSYPAVAGDFQRPLRTRFDHANHRHMVAFRQVVEGNR